MDVKMVNARLVGFGKYEEIHANEPHTVYGEM